MHVLRVAAGAAGRILRREDRLSHLQHARPDLVVPRLPAGRRTFGLAGGQWNQRRLDPHRLVFIADPNRRDRRRFRPLSRPADPLRSNGAARPRVRSSSGGARRRRESNHGARDLAQRLRDDAGSIHADCRWQHPRRSGALVPWRWRAGPDALVGQHHSAGLHDDRHRAMADDRTWASNHVHGDHAQRLRRRPP